MLAPPPLPRTVEASFRDLTASRPAARISSIEDLVRHVLVDPSLRDRALPLLERALHDDRVDALVVPVGKGELVCRKN